MQPDLSGVEVIFEEDPVSESEHYRDSREVAIFRLRQLAEHLST